MKRLTAAALALGIAACARAPVKDELGVQRIAATVERLRGLHRRRALAVEVLDPAEMKRALASHHKPDRRAVEVEGMAWIAFGFVAAGFDLSASIDSVVNEQVVAFYDHRRHRLYLPRPSVAADPAKREEGEGVIAHEVEHALQDHAFGLQRRKGRTEDARLAWAAVVESDAMMVMLAYLSEGKQIALDLVFERFGSLLGESDGAAFAAKAGSAPALAAAPALLRESLVFPYVGAVELLTVLHRSGAFPLVDEAFRHPPISTEQVLHPQKYLAGEAPIPVRDPAIPRGFRGRFVDTLGELRTRVLLASCLPPRDARESAAGWGGDRFLVAESPDGRLVLLWSTVWDDELAAIRFERALLVLSHSWKAPPVGPRPSVSNEATIVRDGMRVAFVRGVPEAEALPLVGGLHALVGATPPLAPPIPARPGITIK